MTMMICKLAVNLGVTKADVHGSTRFKPVVHSCSSLRESIRRRERRRVPVTMSACACSGEERQPTCGTHYHVRKTTLKTSEGQK
jgi:hypothetical protein